MHYYLSAPNNVPIEVKRWLLNKKERMSYLFSFATNKEEWREYYQDGKNNIIMDSGAFSAWNSGKVIDREEYLRFIKTLPEDVFKINLDVIPRTGATTAEKLKCIEEGFNNFKYLSARVENVVPVHHYGEDISWAKKFLNFTDYICISPANDTPEAVKQTYFKYIFSELPKGVKTHTLGYSSLDGLSLFPFYSLDSISFKKPWMFGNTHFKRSDGSIIDLDLNDYAKARGMHYNVNKPMKDPANLPVLNAALKETIECIIGECDRLTLRNKKHIFTNINNQIKLF
jgi:hypothetical protein